MCSLIKHHSAMKLLLEESSGPLHQSTSWYNAISYMYMNNVFSLQALQTLSFERTCLFFKYM